MKSPCRQSSHNCWSKKGFTLIELLVVIAILALLAAILFPVFSRARENARRASCQSNLKQMGMAVMQYSQDYDEYYPRALSAQPTNAATTPGGVWFSNNWVWPQLLFPYHKSVQVFACPSGHHLTKSMPTSYHYGANDIIMPVAEAAMPFKQSAIQAVAQTYLLFDSGQYRNSSVTYARSVPDSVLGTTTAGNQYMPGNGDATGRTCTNSDSFTRNDCQSGRHFGGINMAFADGHVKWLKSSEVYQESIKPADATAKRPQIGGNWRPENG